MSSNQNDFNNDISNSQASCSNTPTKINFKNIINTLKCGILIINYSPSFSMEYANDYFYELIGYTKNEYHQEFNDNILARVYPDDLQKLKANIARQLSMGGIIRFEFRVIKKDGSIAWIMLNGTKHYEDSLKIHASFTDITESKLLYNDIAEKNLELDTIYNNINGGLIKLTLNDFRIIYANDGFYKFIGYSKEEFLHLYGNVCTDIIHKDDINAIYDIMEKSLGSVQLNFRIFHKDGTIRWTCLNASRIGAYDGKPVYLCTLIDVTKSKTYEQALELQQKKQQILNTLSGEWLWEYDILADKLVRTSSAYQMFDNNRVVYNYRTTTLDRRIIHQDDVDKFNEFCNHLESGRENIEAELRMKNKDSGNYSWYKLVATTIYDYDGDAICVIGKTTDVDATHEAIDELQNQITKDSLTKCYNHVTVQTMIDEKLSDDSLLPYAFLLIDIDHFRGINESLGRLFGDSLLVESANIIQSTFNSEIIGRMGTDVFGVFLTHVKDKEDIENNIKQLRKKLEKVYVGDNNKLTCSIGIAYTTSFEPNFEIIFKKADISLYSAKNDGRNTHAFYSKELGYNNEIHTLNEYNMENSFSSLQSSIDSALLNTTIDLLFNASDTINSIKILFKKICEYFKCDYASLVSLRETKSGNYTLKDLWVPHEYRPTDKKVTVPSSTVKEHLTLFNHDNMFYCSDIENIQSKAPAIYEWLGRNNTKSVLQCGNFIDKEFRGFLTLGNCKSPHSWSLSEVKTVSLLCKVIFPIITKLPVK